MGLVSYSEILFIKLNKTIWKYHQLIFSAI